MVSWSEDDSSENSHQYADSAADEGIIKIPETIDDSDFEGTEPDVLCNDHSLPAERRVAFQGIHTGRRFFACAVKEGRNCGLVEWVDPFWPATMENALTKLWDKYEECRRSKIEDNLESSFAVHNLTRQKIKLQASYERLVEDVNGLLDAQEQRAQLERGKMQNKPDERFKL
uniref:GRF-type domain-containing protein n=1 Tax=Triticum urartu TaxID=4572 RepID=A0A8R7VDM8_TRIUA